VIKAQPQLASTDPAVIKQIPRNQRKIVMIDSILTDYYPDITNLLSAPDITGYVDRNGTGPQPGMMQAAPGAPGVDALTGETAAPPVQPGGTPPPAPTPGAAGSPRGFVMTVHCVTPFATGDQLVQNKVLPALTALKSMNKDRSYAIVKAQLVSPIKVNEDATRKSKMLADYQAALTAANVQLNSNPGGAAGVDAATGGGPPLPGGGNPAAAPGGPNDQNAFLDRTLGESVLNDWEITFVVLVQLDPPPPAPAASGPAPGTSAGITPQTPQASAAP
jgi:hypothetical protein